MAFTMLTYGGLEIDPMNLRDEDIEINYIAHSLSRICRYNGHTRDHYSVAQHAVLLSWYVPTDLRRYALMHDAAEAIVGDIARPVRDLLGEAFDKIERVVEWDLERKFKYTNRMPELKSYDVAICHDEMAQLFDNPDAYLAKYAPFLGKPLGIVIDPWPADAAKMMFLGRFEELFGE